MLPPGALLGLRSCSFRSFSLMICHWMITKGPGWYSPAEREERLFTNNSNRPGDDMKEALRTDGNIAVWQAWTTTQNQLRQLL